MEDNKYPSLSREYPHINSAILTLGYDRKGIKEYVKGLTLYEITKGRGVREGFSLEAFRELSSILLASTEGEKDVWH